jgi:uncharacterized membrane protein
MVDHKNKKQKAVSDLENKFPLDILEPLQEIIDLVPEQKRHAVIDKFRFLFYERHYKGIIPSPDDLKKYNEVIPNGADRLTRLAEEQSKHRQELEKKVITSQIKQSSTGQWMAFIIAIFSLSITAYLSLNGQTTVASILASTTIIGLASVFVLGKKSQKKDLEEKS